jgi:hypothetical protein
MGYDYISSSNYGVAINENESIEVAGMTNLIKLSLYQINSLLKFRILPLHMN